MITCTTGCPANGCLASTCFTWPPASMTTFARLEVKCSSCAAWPHHAFIGHPRVLGLTTMVIANGYIQWLCSMVISNPLVISRILVILSSGEQCGWSGGNTGLHITGISHDSMCINDPRTMITANDHDSNLGTLCSIWLLAMNKNHQHAF